MIDGLQNVGDHAILEIRKKRIKQVLIIYDDGSMKGYNRNAFIKRIGIKE